MALVMEMTAEKKNQGDDDCDEEKNSQPQSCKDQLPPGKSITGIIALAGTAIRIIVSLSICYSMGSNSTS